MNKNELTEKQDTLLYIEGRRLGIKSAFVGSIVFGCLYLVLIYVNTYLIAKIDAPFDISTFFISIIVTFIITMFANALAYFPARFMGGRLANSLEIDARHHALSEKSAITKGAQFGAVAGCMICLPILLLQFLFILLTRHGDIIPSIFLSGGAIIIASIAGGWTGKQLHRFIIK